MPCSLPLELILLIISHVAKNKDEESLKRLSLTSSALRGPCQRVLFSELALTSERLVESYQGCKTPGERLLNLLSSSSSVASYVKKITLSDGGPRWASWSKTDEMLSKALHKLDFNNIEAFTLYLNGTWHEFPSSLRGVITEICQSPALLEIALRSSPVELLQFCGPSLKRVIAIGLSDVGALHADATDRSCEFNLEYLSISHERGISALGGLIMSPTWIRVTRLSTLQVEISCRSDFVWVRALIHHFRQSLESLVLEVGADIRNARPNTSPIAECPNLTELGLIVDVDIDQVCLASAVELICNVPPSNRLGVVSLGVRFEGDGGAFNEIDPSAKKIASKGLRMLSRIVMNSAHFPSLEALNLDIIIPGSAEDISTIHGWALDALSIPLERNMVHLSVYLY